MPARAVSADFEEFPPVDLRHLEFISGLQVEEFSITPAVIKPLQKATITWKVSHEDGRQVPDLWLTGVGKIPPSGSVEVAPLLTTAYRLQWKVLNRGWNGGTRMLTVDRSICFRSPVPASAIHKYLTLPVFGEFLARHPGVVEEWQNPSGNPNQSYEVETTINGLGITMSIPFLDLSGGAPTQSRVSIRVVVGVSNGRLNYHIGAWELFRAEN